MTDEDGRSGGAGGRDAGGPAADSPATDRTGLAVPGDLGVRLGVLLGLAAVALALAAAGGALGLTDPLADPDSEAEIVISEDNITVLTGEREVLMVDSMRSVREVQVSTTDDGFQLNTERGTQLTDDERERALAIAGNNETIREKLGNLEAHTVTVQAVLDSDDVDTQPADIGGVPSPDVELVTDSLADEDVDVHLSANVSDDNSVTIRRQVTSDGKEVAVTVIDTESGRSQYSLVVDPVASDRVQGQQANTEIEQYSLVINLETERVVEVRNDSADW